MQTRRTPASRTARTAATAALALLAALTPGPLPCLCAEARADEAAAAPAPSAAPRPFPTREEAASGARRGAAKPGAVPASGNWWLGTAGIAVALAACGWASVAARRYRPGGVAGAAGLRVVGRTNLTPRHSVYLLRAGERVLIVGTGPQGAPSLLGELDADELAQTQPPAPAQASSYPAARGRASDLPGRPPGPGRLDLRLGDDE